MTGSVEAIERQLVIAKGDLSHAERKAASACERSANSSQARRLFAHQQEATAFREVERQRGAVARLELKLERAKRDAGATRDLVNIAPGWSIRDRYGWHSVVRVSKKSVSVKTPWPWTARIALERILETRAPAGDAA